MENDEYIMLRKQSFSELVKSDKELSSLRQEFASMPAEERKMAADYEYNSYLAADLFNNLLLRMGKEDFQFKQPDYPGSVIALAIDPLYAPAILTVASIEYQLGRIEEAMKMFFQLLELPKDEEDLIKIIDEAGDFLIEYYDYKNAFDLYYAAEKAFPNETTFINGTGYCYAKLGNHVKSEEKYRQAVALEPDNYCHLNDLGYCLLEAGKFDEAEEILIKAISLAPEDYEYPRNNLKILQNLRNPIDV